MSTRSSDSNRPGATFIGVHLSVADMAAALDFYRRIGLAVPDGSDAAPHVELDLGHGVHIALSNLEITRAYDPGWRAPSGPPRGALQFRLPSREAVDRLYEQLVSAGYTGHLEPFDAFWGNRYAEVDDADGNRVGFHSPRPPRGTPHGGPGSEAARRSGS